MQVERALSLAQHHQNEELSLILEEEDGMGDVTGPVPTPGAHAGGGLLQPHLGGPGPTYQSSPMRPAAGAARTAPVQQHPQRYLPLEDASQQYPGSQPQRHQQQRRQAPPRRRGRQYGVSVTPAMDGAVRDMCNVSLACAAHP